MSKLEERVMKALRRQKKTALPLKELAKRANVGKKEQQQFKEIVDRLMEENLLMEKNGKLILAENLGLISAEIVKVTNTFGFARPTEAAKDVFIPGRMLRGAMPGDQVLLRQTRGSGELPEGEVYKITIQADRKFSAVMSRDGERWVAIPDRYVKFPIPVHPRKRMDAKEGEKVLCELSARGERHSEHRARVVAVFGSADSAAACCQAVLAANDIDQEFPPEALEQARAIAAGQGIHPKELAQRLDLRDKVIFTIDGADSKDLDDAISLEKREDGWELGVHIADVSYYVTHQTPLDQEALRRGTSVYYADSVIPMLPAELSNGICSLNPQEDRLAFSAFMELDKHGNTLKYRFQKSVIRSAVKGVYSEVNAILGKTADEAILQKYAGLTNILYQMQELAAMLTRNRFARGGMNLDSVESKILLYPDGRVKDIQPRSRGVSEQMIEEFMLTANEAAAHLAQEKALPFVYRVHESPAPDKITALGEVLDQLGIPFRHTRTGSATSSQLCAVLDRVRGTELESVVNTMVLRSMAKAKYAEENIGHFGLALEDYAHFTSPIRRYPDLTIHRILSGLVTGMKQENIRKRFGTFVVRSAKQSTDREIAAMTAERSCADCYKAEYMRGHLGEEFDGVITTVTAFGLYIQLPNTVEGLVHLSRFPQGDWQPQGQLSFVDRITGKAFRVGDPVRVLASAADVSAGTIDFDIVSHGA